MAATVASFIAGIVILLACCGFEEFGCSSKAQKMGVESDYGPFQGCMIQVDRRWIPLESYRTIGGVD